MRLLSFLFQIFGFPSVFRASTNQRIYTLELTNEIINPDGNVSRSAVLANKTFPGPLISANKFDQLQINVINNLTDTSMAQGTSLHWHGLLQHRTAAQDGVAWVTQCPISPGAEFQYNFNVGDQAGTFWYHSHVTTQYCDGLRGPLVIYDHDEDRRTYNYDVDDENTVITLGDWFHWPSPEMFRNESNPDSTVINGRGRFVKGSPQNLTNINVKKNVSYRFRVINTACISAFVFSIDKHELTVIEVDGIRTKPVKTDMVPLFPGQRVSVVVNANQEVDNYWIRAFPFVLDVPPKNETGVDAAILRYEGSDPSVEPTSSQTGDRVLREEELEPYKPDPRPKLEPGPHFTFEIGTVKWPGHLHGNFTINGQAYIPPSLPVLLQIMSGSVDPISIMPKGSVIKVPPNALITVTILGGSPGAPHPFHLHGHDFEVIHSAGSVGNASNFKNPPMRDVVATGSLKGDDVTFQFKTDNPGPWFLHCHIDFHLEAGLAIIFAEDPEGQIDGPNSQEIPENWKSLCPDWEKLTSGKQYSVSDYE